MQTQTLLESTTETITDRNGNTKPATEKQKITDGGAHVAVKSQSFPSDTYVQIDGTAQTSVTADIYLSGNVSTFDYHVIEAITAAAKVEITRDGSTWIQIALEIEDDVTAGQPKSLTIAAGESGIYRGKCLNLRVRPNAATSTNARIAHGNI